MSTALQLQFFMVQAVNLSAIIVKMRCELLNPYNFVIFNEFYYTSWTMSRRDVEAPKTLASRSRPASQKLQRLVSEKILIVSVSKTWVSGLVSAQKVLCTSLNFSANYEQFNVPSVLQ